jgi:5-methylcytosine-specific restriction endonuclease McrA
MSTEILERPTLVLNRHWQPVHVTTVARSLVMLWNDAAKVVEPEQYRLIGWDEWITLVPEPDEPAIRAARSRLRVPEVICLTRYDRTRSSAVAFSRRNVAKRDHHTCQYCGIQPGGNQITIDHVLPRSQGGASTWTNCVAACAQCNTRKADRTPEQAGMRLRRRPIRPDWRPHYAAKADRIASWTAFLNEGASLALA